MKFLNKGTEKLLQECIDNGDKFPQNLADKFEGLSFAEEERLRSQIRELIDNKLITKLQWADNVPWFGAITEAGYDYFRKKDVYVGAKLKDYNTFNVLDGKCENTLKKLLALSGPVYIGDGDKEISDIMTLSENGYVSLVRDRGQSKQGEPFAGWVHLTEEGENYFVEKEKAIEEIILLSEDKFTGSTGKLAHNKSNDNRPPRAEAKHQNSEGRVESMDPKILGERKNRIIFGGILGNNCGTVKAYTGSNARIKEKGFLVENGIPTIRGYAKISDLATASHAQYEEYQRDKDPKHAEKIAEFLCNCKEEAKFLPEVILSVNDATKARLIKYDHKSLANISDTARGAIDNLDYYILEVDEGALTRVDGNHRLEAGTGKDYFVPFAIIVWNIDYERKENMLSNIATNSNTESEAFLFYILNNTAKKLQAEENFKGLVKSKSWSENELALINRQLPLLKYFNDKYASNPLIDKKLLYAPLSQVCEILTEINSPDIGKEEFDSIFQDSQRILFQSERFPYCQESFPTIFFQLAFYTRYKSDDYEHALSNLTLVNKWLEKYKYTSDTFTRASKVYDVAYRSISVSPKCIFMAMEYKSDHIVADYNNALKRAVHTLNNMGGNIELEAYPIMTGKGKTYDLIADIFNKIANCDIFIADISEANPNVLYELGLARSKNIPSIIVRDKIKGKQHKIPSDIRNDNYYNFNGIEELETLFVTHIKEILEKDYGAVFP